MTRQDRVRSGKAWGLPVLLAGLLLASGSAWAQGGGPLVARKAQDPVSVIDSVPVTAAADSEVDFGAMQLEFLSDGSRRLSGSGSTREQEMKASYFFAADPVLATYQAVRLTDVVEENREILDRFLEPYTELQAKKTEIVELLAVSSVPPSLEPVFQTLAPDNCFQRQDLIPNPDESFCDICSGSWTIELETLDPIFVELTRTTNRGNWREGGICTCRWTYGGSKSCWAANPSSLGTHWFVTSCSQVGPISIYRDFYQRVNGSSFNDDFGLNSLRTWVSQSLTLELIPLLGVSWSFSHSDSGEGSLLIFGSFSTAGSNTCF